MREKKLCWLPERRKGLAPSAASAKEPCRPPQGKRNQAIHPEGERGAPATTMVRKVRRPPRGQGRRVVRCKDEGAAPSTPGAMEVPVRKLNGE